MTDPQLIPPPEHQRQIEAYRNERPSYEAYATVLERVLKQACAVAIPEASVQVRAKTLSSFAEKCARRYERYPDAVNQMTDLCGARVIVQTLEHVRAVREFIEANFEILERDDKALQLSEDKIGYRDLHNIIQLRPACCQALGISEKEQQVIGERRAEVQVRTWLQHAWADTLHDRIYKNPLQLPLAIRRTGALLAALMEEGDRNFDGMAHELDGMIANYTALASRDAVAKEIDVQKLILENQPTPEKKPGLALGLARLLEACGDYPRVVAVLEPYSAVNDANRCELLQVLGYALCKMHRKDPQAAEFQRGRRFLEESLGLCGCAERPFVPHLRKRESLHARALSRLGWVQEQIPGEEHRAREYKYQAHEHEPANPYYLADMLGFEIYCERHPKLPATMRPVLGAAIATGRDHALAGIELPGSCFTAGRLSLLLDQTFEALGYYARGIRHVLARERFFPAEVLAEEITWLQRLHFGSRLPPSCQWVLELLALAERIARLAAPAAAAPRVLLVAGGAASIDAETLASVRPLLYTALPAFAGTVISGGTVVGVPGLVGEIAAELKAQGNQHFELIGYIPEHLPYDGPRDARYDDLRVRGRETFSPEQVLASWQDLLAEGIHPQNILVLGFGGGPLSAFEYHAALAFGASVAVVIGTGGAADAILEDALWSGLSNLLPLPHDAASVWAYLAPPSVRAPGEDSLEQMAMAFHDHYVANSAARLPENMRPWSQLAETYRQASRAQARHAVRILETCGFGVREVQPPATPVIFRDFSDEEVERMAELEHGRWNLERLRAGWRFGPRDDARRRHPCLVPWSKKRPDAIKEERPNAIKEGLPDAIKEYDRNAVRHFPEILARAGLEVIRKA